MYKGLIFHSIAKIIFVLAGYIMHYFLGLKLTPYEYGLVGTITTILDFEYLFLNNGVRQAVSNTISQNKYDVKDLFMKGMIFQIAIVGILCLVNLCGANLFGVILNDQRLVKYIKFAAALIPFNGLYFVILGTINGFCRFKIEAILCSVYPLLKLSVIPYILYVFDDAVMGTEVGYFTAVFGIFILAAVMLWGCKRDFLTEHNIKINMAVFIKRAANFSVFFMVVSILLSIDTLILKAVEEDGAIVGYYTGAVTFGKVSYYLLQAFYIVLLPVVSKHYEKKEMEQANKTISNMILVIVAFIMPISVIMAATSRDLLTSFYNSEYGVANKALSLLVLNNFAVGMVVVFNMIISTTNKKMFSSVLSIIMVMVQIPLCYILGKKLSMNGVALAGSICSIVAMCISAYMVIKLFGNIFTKRHYVGIGINVLLFLIVSNIGFKINNLLQIIIFYMIIYAIVIMAMQMLRVIQFKNLLQMFRGEGK